ncbi:unnamed protein product [Prorocentrum cordatum]|uniref:N-acetyltransferase domain-containing protein n=1 Tax=Prorocentrum cordatum TaxID=2364126 RepID=A0ABN9WG02_9DINO|nr:unnamed protein product [Polarella glacialis]
MRQRKGDPGVLEWAVSDPVPAVGCVRLRLTACPGARGPGRAPKLAAAPKCLIEAWAESTAGSEEVAYCHVTARLGHPRARVHWLGRSQQRAVHSSVGGVRCVPHGRAAAPSAGGGTAPVLDRRLTVAEALFGAAAAAAERLGAQALELQAMDNGSGKLVQLYLDMGFTRASQEPGEILWMEAPVETIAALAPEAWLPWLLPAALDGPRWLRGVVAQKRGDQAIRSRPPGQQVWAVPWPPGARVYVRLERECCEPSTRNGEQPVFEADYQNDRLRKDSGTIALCPYGRSELGLPAGQRPRRDFIPTVECRIAEIRILDAERKYETTLFHIHNHELTATDRQPFTAARSAAKARLDDNPDARSRVLIGRRARRRARGPGARMPGARGEGAGLLAGEEGEPEVLLAEGPPLRPASRHPRACRIVTVAVPAVAVCAVVAALRWGSLGGPVRRSGAVDVTAGMLLRDWGDNVPRPKIAWFADEDFNPKDLFDSLATNKDLTEPPPETSAPTSAPTPAPTAPTPAPTSAPPASTSAPTAAPRPVSAACGRGSLISEVYVFVFLFFFFAIWAFILDFGLGAGHRPFRTINTDP